MRRILRTLTLAWISLSIVAGCASSKNKLFDDDMPTMKTIHDNKFHHTGAVSLDVPERPLNETSTDQDTIFQWLPNPTLVMYVFPHLTEAGLPVPGYSTFFRLYTQEHIAAPGELQGWE